MKAVIMAGGKGTRMMPLTAETPKPLLKIADEPILTHIIRSLPSVVDEIILVVGYKGEQIRKIYGESFEGKKIIYVEQLKQTGTAHALMLCFRHLPKGEKFLLLNADDLHHKESIEKMLRYDLAILVGEVDKPERFGVVEIDANSRVVRIEEKPEKPKGNLVSVGVYLLDSRIFKYTASPSPTGEYYLTGMLDGLIHDEPVYAEKTAFWIPVGYPEDLKKAEIALAGKK